MIDYTLPLQQLPDPLPIEPLRKPFDVTIHPPGSKSITNRVYVLAALADGESRIIRPLQSDDCDLLLQALCTLGATARRDGEDVLITGVNGRFPNGGEINLGDGGTPTRFMIAAACLAAKPVVINGSKRMRERPIAEGVEMLRTLGADITYVEAEGNLPVRVTPSEAFIGGELKIEKTVSSQFISALMLIGGFTESGVQLHLRTPTSASYILLTLRCMSEFKIRVRRNLISYFSSRRLRKIHIPSAGVSAKEFHVEADASSAVYWGLAAMLCGGSKVVLRPLQTWSPQPDMKVFTQLFQRDGIFLPDEDLDGIEDDGVYCEGENNSHPASMSTNCELYPDGSIALAVAAAVCKEPTTLTGLRTLRVKETDRIAAMANELRKVGCTVEATDDSITIEPMPRDEQDKFVIPSETVPTEIETYNDHRMAMAFGVLGLQVPGIAIRNPACVSKSYPGFWKDFATLYS